MRLKQGLDPNEFIYLSEIQLIMMKQKATELGYDDVLSFLISVQKAKDAAMYYSPGWNHQKPEAS